tara:strand:- start:3855 stop:5699 length:1845 start_codon:yes stop_codon:yes gene_type:complete
MPLINLKTNLKSLKFGKDRPGGGSSNQPYIKSKIPNQDSDQSSILNTGGPDSLLRGGILAPIRAAEDTSRLTQMFADLKSPTGILFTSKQNILSRLSVHTEASSGPGYGAGKVNQGIYTPLSTIGQAGVGITGTHLNTFGLDPSSPMTGTVQGGLFPGIGLKRYEGVVKRNNLLENRLEQLLFANELKTNLPGAFGENFNLGNSIIEYSGGPGSILGVGKTRIRYADQRTGKHNERATNEPDYFYSGSISQFRNPTEDFISPLSKTNYGEIFNEQKLDRTLILVDGLSKSGGKTWEKTKSNKVYPTSDSLNSDPEVTGTTTWTQQQIIGVENDRVKGQITDFREKLDAPTDKKVLGKLAKGYTTNIQIGKRVNYGDPGKSKDVTKYGVTYKGAPLDIITASDIYEGSIADHSGLKNDLCKFSIGIIKNDIDGKSNFMHFRAFIDGFSDSYTADWGDTQYVGRADKFYNYKGFGREISLSFTVAAQSKDELIPMYKKLNYLASSLAPSYSQGGFMQGNLVRLTVGGYLYNQVGILKAITYTIPQESPWEIGLSDGDGEDHSVKELPHIIKVTGFSFIPIQDFVPQVSPNPKNQSNNRFISLANGSGPKDNNYNNS